MPLKQNAAAALNESGVEPQTDTKVEDISEDYKKLAERCDAVMTKIKGRKNRKKK